MSDFDKYQDKVVYDPIEFFNPDKGEPKRSPIVFEHEHINSKENFAILKTTEGGKYVRGNMLFYKFNGVEIYTELNNLILVDVLNKVLTIRSASEVISEIAPKSPERKQYIILYVDMGYDESDEIPLRWESYIGRQNAYNVLLTQLPVIDLDRSKVLVDNVPLKDSLSVRKFLEYLKNANLVPDDDFDIDDSYEFEDEDYI